MVDLKKYADIYEEIKKLSNDDTLQLVLETEDEEVKDFYEVVGDFLLQQRQREVVSKNLFQVLLRYVTIAEQFFRNYQAAINNK